MPTNENTGYLVQLQSPEGDNLYPIISAEMIKDAEGNTYNLPELFQSVSEGKSAIAAAVTDKGVTTAADATFQQIATNIASIFQLNTSDATALAAHILYGQTAYVNGSKITGTMPNNGAVNQALNCGASYTIPAGYHNGSGKVTANSLASQTSATATAAQILSGYTAWVNGNKLTGTAAASPVSNPHILNSLVAATMDTDMGISVSNNFNVTYFPKATFYRAEVRAVIDTSGGIVDYSRIELTYNYDDTFTSESIQARYNYTTNTLKWVGGSDPYLTLSSATVLSDGRVQLQYTLNPDEDFVITSGEPYLRLTTKNTAFLITPKNSDGYDWAVSAPYNSATITFEP